MTLLSNGFEGQASGTGATGANSVNSGVALAFNRTGSSTSTYSSAHPAHGSMGLLLASAAANPSAVVVTLAASTTSVAARRYFYTDALPSATVNILGINSVYAYLRADGKVEIHNKSGTTIFTSTAVLSINTQYRLEMAIATGTGTTDGQIYFAIYTGDSTTALSGSTYTATTVDMGTGTFNQVAYGRSQGGTAAAWSDWIDDLAAQDGTTSFIGPATVANAAPTANAGTDQTAVEPYIMVVLDGSTSTDSDGTITSYTWSQTAGTTVSLTGANTAQPTFTAPATVNGDTLTFSLTVTDNDGATSTADTVNITILPHTMWRLDAGAPTPVQLLKL